MPKINPKERSQIANDTKKSYIRKAKAQNMVRKLNTTAKNSKLHQLKKHNEEDSEQPESELETDNVSTESDDSEQFVVRFDSESEHETKRRLKKPLKRENTHSKQLLELQREIETIKLQQIRETKKTNRAIAQAPVVPLKNNKVDALKNQLLVQFD